MKRFCIEVIAATPNPQQVVWAAMHQDYSEHLVWESKDRWPDEQRCGELVVKHLLYGDRGHYGPTEHPQITFAVGYFPHSTMQQLRTHRVGVSFDVQCLAGDTEVTFVKASGSLRKIKIAELYDLWANGEKAIRSHTIPFGNEDTKGTYRRDCKSRMRKMNLRVLNEDTGLFEIGHVQGVFDQGVQPVYRLTLEDGKTLDCTENHRLLTKEGWRTMGEAVGLITGANQEVIAYNRDCHLMTNGIVVGEGLLLKVVRVQYIGLQKTYDIEVAGQWHNFVANGVVVHNSFRYTGQRIINVAEGKQDIEEVFYLRPVGNYSNRQGKRYFYSEEQREDDLQWCLKACHHYKQRLDEGLAEEHARGLLPFDVRQHFHLSCNLRSLMHLLDLRWKKDAQLEAQKFCELLWIHFEKWTPAIAQWYIESRAQKAKLAP